MSASNQSLIVLTAGVVAPKDGGLLVSPRSRLTPDDDEAIRTYKDEIKLLVAYVEVM